MIIDLDDGPIDTSAPRYVQPTEGRGVSATAAQRIAGQAAALATLGIDSRNSKGEWNTDAGFAIGTRARQSDVTGRLREERINALEMPPAIGALEILRDRARSLDRRAADYHLTTLVPSPITDDLNVVGAGTRYAMTADAWGHLGAFYGAAGLSAYLPVAAPSVRHAIGNFHTGAIKAEREKTIESWRAQGAKGAVPDARKVRLASRLKLTGEGAEPGPRQVYRIATENYAPFEVLDACEQLLASPDVRGALAGARASVKWDGRRASLDLIWTADESLYAGLGDFAAGDTFQYAQRIVLDEVKSASTSHYSFSRRNECLNMIIISTRKGERASWRHTGEAGATVAAGLLARVQSHRAAVDSFVGTWVGARRDRILDECGGDARKMFGALLCEGLIDLPGLRTVEKKVDALCAAHAKEAGSSLADIVNAATRCAHEGDWWNSTEAQEAAEVDGGKLLYVKNIRARVASGLAAYNEYNGDDGDAAEGNA